MKRLAWLHSSAPVLYAETIHPRSPPVALLSARPVVPYSLSCRPLDADHTTNKEHAQEPPRTHKLRPTHTIKKETPTVGAIGVPENGYELQEVTFCNLPSPGR
jgi:hypothetical protein